MLLRRLGRLADARDAFDALRLQPDYARAQAELDSLPAR